MADPFLEVLVKQAEEEIDGSRKRRKPATPIPVAS
jgi:hypothetical protein